MFTNVYLLGDYCQCQLHVLHANLGLDGSTWLRLFIKGCCGLLARKVGNWKLIESCRWFVWMDLPVCLLIFDCRNFAATSLQIRLMARGAGKMGAATIPNWSYLRLAKALHFMDPEAPYRWYCGWLRLRNPSFFVAVTSHDRISPASCRWCPQVVQAVLWHTVTGRGRCCKVVPQFVS